MNVLLIFLIIVTAGLVFTELSSRFNVPYVTALIVAGIVFGKSGLGLIEQNSEISFLGNIGVIFLMFLAGASIDLTTLKNQRKEIITSAALNGLIPFLTGFGITYIISQNIQLSLIIGIIFISSAIAVVIPTLENLRILSSKLGNAIISTTVVEDITSLIILAIVIQQAAESSLQSILISLVAIVLILFFLKDWIKKAIDFIDKMESKSNKYESRLRFVLVFLFSMVVFFGFLGLNSIVASFIAGMVIGDYIKKTHIQDKIKTIAYGIFIPIFFFLVGVDTDFNVLSSLYVIGLTILIVLTLFISKFVSGYLAGRLQNFSQRESTFFGVATVSQLSTTLAVAFTASESGLIPLEYQTAIVVLTILTATMSPIFLNIIGKQFKDKTGNLRNQPEDPVIN